MLPGLKLLDLVQLRNRSWSHGKNFEMKPLEKGTVGRVKKIYDTGGNFREHRFLIYIRIPGHLITNFFAEELTKVKA